MKPNHTADTSPPLFLLLSLSHTARQPPLEDNDSHLYERHQPLKMIQNRGQVIHDLTGLFVFAKLCNCNCSLNSHCLLNRVEQNTRQRGKWLSCSLKFHSHLWTHIHRETVRERKRESYTAVHFHQSLLPRSGVGKWVRQSAADTPPPPSPMTAAPTATSSPVYKYTTLWVAFKSGFFEQSQLKGKSNRDCMRATYDTRTHGSLKLCDEDFCTAACQHARLSLWWRDESIHHSITVKGKTCWCEHYAYSS